jgi:glucose-1-phosphate cytidylyltransferase
MPTISNDRSDGRAAFVDVDRPSPIGRNHMKVVLFCGGQGMRLRDYSDQIPKPLVHVGQRPILWHLMKYYAHFGHTEFVLCLGHGALKIKEFFLRYNEWESNDFVLTEGGRNVEMLGTDIDDWSITFVDTGRDSSIGERLRRVREHVDEDEMFLANYADGLSDLDLDAYIDEFRESDMTAQFLAVPAPHTFHIVHADDEGFVERLEHIATSPVRINAGFFALRREIFDVMQEGEELVLEPFQRLIAERKLRAISYDGFWQNMDTFKDKVQLDAIAASDSPPWRVWDPGR